MIAGLEDITSGELYIGERLVNDVAPKDRDIAMVFQNYALYPNMTVYQNMAFGLRMRHTPKEEIDERVKSAAEILDIQDYLDRKPKQLSGGQRQRVALGRAIVREPQVFLMDEPLSNLDAKLRVQTRAEIARLHQRIKTTTVYVTHDQVEAMTMGDRIAVLNAGIIQQLGTPQELYDHPANLFVAGFIGSPSMNFFDARLVRKGNNAALLIGTGDKTHELTIEGPAAAVVAGHATAGGQAVIAGIRPEDLALADQGTESGPSAANTISGTVDVAEHLGNEQLVYVQVIGARVSEHAETKGTTARLPPNLHLERGNPIALKIDPTKLHVFDAATSRRFV
jgi:multiple sugar transport system ATP-binding protein